MRDASIWSGAAVLALGVAVSLPAQAVTQNRTIRSHGGTACALSIPTTDTKVRPKASGFRNEGTTAAFIICGYPLPNGALTFFNLNFTAIDGNAHTVNCTGVNGPPWAPVFVAKSGEASASQLNLSWSAADFGGTSGQDMPTGYMSVTCVLPAQVGVDNVFVNYIEDVGA
jgi:hypothetical protein